jgi:hypothetical protein
MQVRNGSGRAREHVGRRGGADAGGGSEKHHGAPSAANDLAPQSSAIDFRREAAWRVGAPSATVQALCFCFAAGCFGNAYLMTQSRFWPAHSVTLFADRQATPCKDRSMFTENIAPRDWIVGVVLFTLILVALYFFQT